MLAFISGASRGIGAACAVELAKQGCDIIINYKERDDAALSVKEKIEALGQKAELFRFDVSDQEVVERCCAEIIKKFGAPDILVNNAGVSVQKQVQDYKWSDWDEILDTNLKGQFLLTRAFVPGMVSRKSGCIINISSMWGQVGASCEAAYSASKGGIIAFTKSLAKELGPSGIRVNAVAPGLILTDMCACLPKEVIDGVAADAPLGRNGQPEDIAYAVAFLASDKASFITGQILGVNGGFVI